MKWKSPPGDPSARPRIKDVARALGMSVATVSRALSKPNEVNAETRKRVLSVVERLSYRPNLLARSLRVGRSKTLLMLTPTLSPFFLEVYQGAEEAGRESGFAMLLASDGGNAERELAYFEQVLSGRADGIISLTGFVPSLYAPGKQALPTIVTALEPLQGHKTPAIRVDHRVGATAATRHLIELGHRRIAHITGHRAALSSAERLAGYQEALQAAGIPYDSTLVEQGDFSVASGVAVMERFLALKEVPTAVFAANDESAFGAMYAIVQRGLSVPEDVSVIGFDDLAMAAICNPPLTTVRIPRHEVGRRAAQELIKVINGDKVSVEMTLRTQLILRKSTARPARGRVRRNRY